MPPRRRLHRLWLVMRLNLVGMGLGFASVALSRYVGDWAHEPFYDGLLVSALLALLLAAVSTPEARGRVHMHLGGLGRSGSAQQRATAISTMLGGAKALDAVSKAAARFRVLALDGASADELTTAFRADAPPRHKGAAAAGGGGAVEDPTLRDLHEEDRVLVVGGAAPPTSSSPTLSGAQEAAARGGGGMDSTHHAAAAPPPGVVEEAPTIFARTRMGTLGRCSAFVSHSHTDPPHHKAQQLTAWRHARYGAEEGVTVWLDVASLPRVPRVTREDLLCLPVFVSGCLPPSGLSSHKGPTHSPLHARSRTLFSQWLHCGTRVH